MQISDALVNVLKSELAEVSGDDLAKLAIRLEAVAQAAAQAALEAAAPKKKRGRPRKDAAAGGDIAAAPVAKKRAAGKKKYLNTVAGWGRYLADKPGWLEREKEMIGQIKVETHERETALGIERTHGYYGRVSSINGHSTAHLGDLELERLLKKLHEDELPPEWRKREIRPRNVVRLLPGTGKLLSSASRDGRLVSDFFSASAA